jgi:hypothetical protein
LRDNNAVWVGFGLGAFAVAGAILTFGLVRRWGEVFPPLDGRAGRSAGADQSGGRARDIRRSRRRRGGFLSSPRFLGMMGDLNAAAAPMMLWPAWAVALGAATLAYHLRRRGSCARCLRTD